MPAKRSTSRASRPSRHPRPPLPSRLKPAQYAKLKQLVVDPPNKTNHFYGKCRELLAKCGYGEFSIDDLIDEALLRLFLGDLPKGMKFPTKKPDLINAVERLGRRHVDNANRRHRHHGPRPIPLEDFHQMEMMGQAATVQTTSLQTMQLDILRRLEEQLAKRVAQLELSNKPSTKDSEEPMESEIELF